MLQITNEILPRHSMLRCVWVPSHTGIKAPLTAVWIEAKRPCSEARYSPIHDLSEGDSWASVA